MELTIRPMQPEDVDAVWEIEQKSYPTPWPKSAFFHEIGENSLAYYLVLVADGKLAGYGGIWVFVGEAHITTIAVEPEMRGQKLGETLLQALIYLARHLEAVEMTLEVRVSNFVAQNLYRKVGFLTTGVRKKYYADGEDALIMWLEDLTKAAERARSYLEEHRVKLVLPEPNWNNRR